MMKHGGNINQRAVEILFASMIKRNRFDEALYLHLFLSFFFPFSSPSSHSLPFLRYLLLHLRISSITSISSPPPSPSHLISILQSISLSHPYSQSLLKNTLTDNMITPHISHQYYHRLLLSQYNLFLPPSLFLKHLHPSSPSSISSNTSSYGSTSYGSSSYGSSSYGSSSYGSTSYGSSSYGSSSSRSLQVEVDDNKDREMGEEEEEELVDDSGDVEERVMMMKMGMENENEEVNDLFYNFEIIPPHLLPLLPDSPPSILSFLSSPPPSVLPPLHPIPPSPPSSSLYSSSSPPSPSQPPPHPFPIVVIYHWC